MVRVVLEATEEMDGSPDLEAEVPRTITGLTLRTAPIPIDTVRFKITLSLRVQLLRHPLKFLNTW